jgi:hypothetical protein
MWRVEVAPTGIPVGAAERVLTRAAAGAAANYVSVLHELRIQRGSN